MKFLNETLVDIHVSVEPLFVTRRFLPVQGEVQIHKQRLAISLDKLNTLRPRLFEISPFEILLLSRNFLVFKFFPLTAMLNYRTC